MIIKAGTHSSIRMPKLLGPEEIKYNIKFTESCRYFIREDQSDINKLFGIGYFPHHKYHSDRFGWRYDISSGQIEVLAYVRLNGKKNWKSLGLYYIGTTYVFSLNRPNPHKKWYCNETFFATHLPNFNDFRSISTTSYPKPYGYLLGPYFGGNQKAPHDIEIIMERVIQ